MPAAAVDVAIIGAGPYGLSLAAHLRVRGIEHRIFGAPMHAWRSMPAGMYLKSLGFATTIPTPEGHLTLPEYCLERGLEDYDPIEIATFAQYGLSVQEQLVDYVEALNVTSLRQAEGHFVLSLENEERVSARRVVVATGLSYFERIPEQLAKLPSGLASHTASHSDFGPFAGRKVAVLGAGQSALQAAALLHKAGADVELLARKPIVWGARAPRERSLLERIQKPGTVIGWGKSKWVIEHVPMLLHHLSDERRLAYNRTKLGPSGAWWLRAEVERNIPMSIGSSLVEAVPNHDGLRLRVSDAAGSRRDLNVDHVVAGTGFTVDVDRIQFIDRLLAEQVVRLKRAPRLSGNFESSVANLYFVGPASVASFGPLFRFVAGSTYTVPHLAHHLARRSVRRVAFPPLLAPASGAASVR